MKKGGLTILNSSNPAKKIKKIYKQHYACVMISSSILVLIVSVFATTITTNAMSEQKNRFHEIPAVASEKISVVSATSTFSNSDACGSYHRDKTFVYFGEMLINGADPDSFEIVGPIPYGLSASVCLSKDKTNVYNNAEKISWLDSHTIEVLSNGYVKDKDGVYYGKTLELVSDADPLMFVSTSTSIFANDQAQIFECGKAVMPNEAHSIALGDYYGVSDSRVYHSGQPIEEADAKTFKLIGGDGVLYCESQTGGYAVDAAHVYFGGKPIIGADPQTFALTGRIGFAKDLNSEYDHGIIIQNDFKACSTNPADLPGGRSAWASLIPQVRGTVSSTMFEFCSMDDGKVIVGYKDKADLEQKTYVLFADDRIPIGKADLSCDKAGEFVQAESIKYLQGSIVRLACVAYDACTSESYYDLDLNKMMSGFGEAISEPKDQEIYDCGYRG
jgi:hypothetical protein